MFESLIVRPCAIDLWDSYFAAEVREQESKVLQEGARNGTVVCCTRIRCVLMPASNHSGWDLYGFVGFGQIMTFYEFIDKNSR